MERSYNQITPAALSAQYNNLLSAALSNASVVHNWDWGDRPGLNTRGHRLKPDHVLWLSVEHMLREVGLDVFHMLRMY